MWPYLAAAVTIIAVAAVLAGWHLRVWRAASQGRLAARERDFAFRQFRRRVQVSAMLAVAGMLIGAGPWIVAPLAALLYWLGVVILVLWIMLLAGADMLATRMHFSRIEAEQNLQEIELRARLNRTRNRAKSGENGQGS